MTSLSSSSATFLPESGPQLHPAGEDLPYVEFYNRIMTLASLEIGAIRILPDDFFPAIVNVPPGFLDRIYTDLTDNLDGSFWREVCYGNSSGGPQVNVILGPGPADDMWTEQAELGRWGGRFECRINVEGPETIQFDHGSFYLGDSSVVTSGGAITPEMSKVGQYATSAVSEGSTMLAAVATEHQDVTSALWMAGRHAASGSTDILTMPSAGHYVAGVHSEDPIRLIAATTEHQDVITALRISGRHVAADRLAALIALIDEDPDELPIVLESLKAFARFLIDERQFDTPRIGTDRDGHVQVEWPVLEQGLLVMNFRPDDLIRFVAVSAPARRGTKRMRVSDMLPKPEVLKAIRQFVHQS